MFTNPVPGSLFHKNSEPLGSESRLPSKAQELPGLLFSENSKPIRTGKRNFCPLLSSIVIRDYNSTYALATKYGVSRQFISYVLHGDKKSKRVEQIIFTEWGITVSEFQQLTLNWLELKSQGKTYTQAEIKDFGDSVRARKLGISVEELRKRKAEILGPIV
ncbi:hypothetical protein ACO1KB_17115 [Leptospira interrogans serovar Szwajizak]|uniref:hypothetical protein n=1 Tax=Leptospira interrogans TaxID=173 RepID=UPI003CF5A47A